MSVDTYLNNKICEYGLNYLASDGKKLGFVFFNSGRERRIGWTHNGTIWANLTFSIDSVTNKGYSSTLIFDPVQYFQTTVKEPAPYVSVGNFDDIEKKTACFIYLYALCDSNGQYITNPANLLENKVDIDKSEILISFETFPKYVFNNGAKFYIKNFTLSNGTWDA
jgi:hypothetical protein